MFVAGLSYYITYERVWRKCLYIRVDAVVNFWIAIYEGKYPQAVALLAHFLDMCVCADQKDEI